jgi:DNA repair exonuclease SbcCD ATPase subunit
MSRLRELHEDYLQQTLQRKDLEVTEERLKNLHQILSKELMYVVLEDALPSLFAIINALLSQIVDYQLHFQLIKSSSDRLELEVEVEDHRGRRPTSSLSGGQKVILKLTWILAVASYMRLPLLLLDETINNLDTALVAKVAELLDDFVRKQNIALYVVTHSPQIQEMNLWEEVVEI